MNIWLYKHNRALKPATEEDRKKFNKISKGQPVKFKHVRVRNPALHRKYFAFIGKVWENLPEKYDKHWPTKRSFRKAMEMYAGHAVETVSLKGQTMLQPKSIAYGELDDIEFSDLYNKVKNIIGIHILPNVDDVENEIANFY